MTWLAGGRIVTAEARVWTPTTSPHRIDRLQFAITILIAAALLAISYILTTPESHE